MISRTRTQVDWPRKILAENTEKRPKIELFHSKNLPEWDQILPKLNIFALQSHQSHHPTQTGHRGLLDKGPLMDSLQDLVMGHILFRLF